MEEILSTVQSEVFGVWFLIGAALVFWMQAGFAMVEAGFTRAKKYRKYPDEESDGFLYWYCYVYPDRFWSGFLGEDLVGLSRKAGFVHFTDYANLTGPISYLTLCSVQLLLPSYLVLWLKEQDSFPTVSTQQ